MHIIIALIASLALLLPGSGILAQSMIESDRGPAANLSQDEPDFDDRLDDDFDFDPDDRLGGDFDGDLGDTLGDRGPLLHREHDFGDISQAPDQSQSQSQSQDQDQEQDQVKNQSQGQGQGNSSAQNSNSADPNTSKRGNQVTQSQSSIDSGTQQGSKNSQGAILGTRYSMDGFIA